MGLSRPISFAVSRPVSGTVQRDGGTDADVLAFAAESGATDLDGLNNLVVYLKGQGLYSDFVVYPYKSAQNAGSGSTVYGLGGWTTNDIATVSSPTWATTGMDFTVAGSSASVTLTGFQSLSVGCVFTRMAPQAAATADGTAYIRWWFGDVVVNKFLGSGASTGSVAGEAYTTFQTPSVGDQGRTGSSTASWSAGEDFTEVCEFGAFGSGAAVYKNKAAFVMGLTIDNQVFTPAVTTYATDDVIYISGLNSGGVAAELVGEYIASAFCKVSLTLAQRESITDFINAL
jgi:hypothetical protein